MRKPPRVLIAVFLVALLVSAVSLWWSYNGRRQGLEDAELAGLIGLAVSVAGIAASLWPTIDSRRESEREQDPRASLDSLAHRLQQQWLEAEDLHRLNDDYALSVAWRGEREGLTQSLETARDMASAWDEETPSRPAPDDADAACHDDVLAGEGADLARILRERVPTGRLVILGEAGSGKTVLVERLLCSMLMRRTENDPVYVRIPLGSWPLNGPGLDAWMASYLIRLEPSLKHAAPRRYDKGTRRADVLLNEGLVVPVLDGFDELKLTARRHVLERINSTLRARRPVVLVSRPAAYREAVDPRDEAAASPLSGAPGIRLLPVKAEQAAKYLRQKSGDWDDIECHLGTESPVGKALRSPLLLFVCRTVYEHPAGAAAGTSNELLDRNRFPDENAIRSHLFASFVPAVYRGTRSGNSAPWSAVKAERTLRHLARHQHANGVIFGSEADLSWWRLPQIAPQSRRRICWAFSLAVATLWTLSLLPSIHGVLFVLYSVPILMVATYLLAGELIDGREPTAGLGWDWHRMPVPAAFGGFMGLALAESHVQTGNLAFSPALYAVFVLLFALVSAAIWGWRPRKADLDRPVTPVSLFNQDRRTFLTYLITWTLTVTLVFSSVLAPALWVSRADFAEAGYGPVALALAQILGVIALFGAAIGFAAAYFQTACGPFALACLRHMIVGRTPLRLLAFLDDAHHRGVLRQVGGTYEFRHVELQRHLASE